MLKFHCESFSTNILCYTQVLTKCKEVSDGVTYAVRTMLRECKDGRSVLYKIPGKKARSKQDNCLIILMVSEPIVTQYFN